MLVCFLYGTSGFVLVFPLFVAPLLTRPFRVCVYFLSAELPECAELDKMTFLRMRRRWRNNAVAKLKALDRWVSVRKGGGTHVGRQAGSQRWWERARLQDKSPLHAISSISALICPSSSAPLRETCQQDEEKHNYEVRSVVSRSTAKSTSAVAPAHEPEIERRPSGLGSGGEVVDRRPS